MELKQICQNRALITYHVLKFDGHPGNFNMLALPTKCWAAQCSGLCGMEGGLPAVTGLTDQMDYLILLTFNKELD